jgi:opacity protein-like surface antigen
MIIALITFTIVEFGFSGDIARKGTTGAEHLLIPVGARSIATSGAFLANTSGTEAIYYNPAGLAGQRSSEVMFSYMSYIADINLIYFALGINFGDIGTFGLSLKSLDFGDIPITTYENMDGTGATYSPSYSILGLTYSKEITERVRAGVNIKLVHEGIMSTTADGFALDFGVQYKFQSNLWLGVTLKNLGGDMAFDGQDLQTKTTVPSTADGANSQGLYSPVTEPYQLPSYFEISAAYSFNIKENNATLGATFHNMSSYEDAVDIGAEVKTVNFLYLRAGYNFLLENEVNNQYGFSCGAGVEYETKGIVLCLDYAYRATKDFSGNQALTVKMAF